MWCKAFCLEMINQTLVWQGVFIQIYVILRSWMLLKIIMAITF